MKFTLVKINRIDGKIQAKGLKDGQHFSGGRRIKELEKEDLYPSSFEFCYCMEDEGQILISGNKVSENTFKEIEKKMI